MVTNNKETIITIALQFCSHSPCAHQVVKNLQNENTAKMIALVFSVSEWASGFNSTVAKPNRGALLMFLLVTSDVM